MARLEINYRVVEMGSGDFMLQEAVEGTPWITANGTYAYSTAAGAITALRDTVDAKKRMIEAFTVKEVIMTEGDID